MPKDLDAVLAEAAAFVAAENARLDKMFFDHHAARALYNINRKFDQDATFEEISERLRATVSDKNPKTLKDRLATQAHILDATFYWLINDASVDKYSSNDRCREAFIAQKQFSKAFQLVMQFEDKKVPKRTDMNQKRTDKTEVPS